MNDYSNYRTLGVCIELRNNNFGSMLQSYATQKVLSQYGIKYELIEYRKKYTPKFILKSIPRLLNHVIWEDKYAEFRKKSFLKKNPVLRDVAQQRVTAFNKFRLQYFTAPRTVYTGYDSLVANSKKYSAFFTGSDQLWTPAGLPTNFYNLMFADKDKLKISYASSFGVKQIPWYQRRRTRDYLQRIQFISCRETSGSHIVKELTGRSVPVVIDPTLHFTGEQWNEMLPCEPFTKEKYILSYILGPDEKARAEVMNLKNRTGLKIISIPQFLAPDLKFGDIAAKNAGPAEFVNLIRNAEFVCTDSFHGTVFSILFKKNFVVFNRYKDSYGASKNTRIDSLCNNLGLQERRFSGNIYTDMVASIDYQKVDTHLSYMRDFSKKYLEDAFNTLV